MRPVLSAFRNALDFHVNCSRTDDARHASEEKVFNKQVKNERKRKRERERERERETQIQLIQTIERGTGTGASHQPREYRTR